MLTDGHGTVIDLTQHTPPDGHSISTASTPVTTKKGRISTGGASSTAPVDPVALEQFINFRNHHHERLQKSTQREQTIARVQNRLDAMDAFLSNDEALFKLLSNAKLRDIILYEGLYIDKLQALTGHATTIIGVQQQRKIDELTPALTQLLKERGLKVTAQERTLEFQTPECGS